MDSRLSRIEDTDAVKDWVRVKIQEAKEEMTEAIQKKYEPLSKKCTRIERDNLLVPDLIGPKGTGTKFQNLKEWIQNKMVEDAKMLETVE